MLASDRRDAHFWTWSLGRYSVAIFSTAVVIWVRSLLHPWLNEECPFALFYLSVLLTAWVAGTGPAVLAIVLGTFSAAHFFIPPANSLLIDELPELLLLIIYMIVNCVAVLLFERAARQRRIAENRASENVRLGQDLQRADKRKDDFLALLAHELRNPLAPIRSGMALLECNEDCPKTVRRVREIVDRQTQHLIRITDDLLEVSRFCRGHIELLVERLDLRISIHDAIEMIEGAMTEKSQRFQSLIPDAPVWVQGDRVRLAQLTANLIGNASKYTPESGRIRLVMETDNELATVSIIDTGIGFAPEHCQRIFEPFVQVDASHTREYGGLGVGLSIAKRLVDLHHGTLTAESRGPGLGSCFKISIPLAPTTGQPGVDDWQTTAPDQTESRGGGLDANVSPAHPGGDGFADDSRSWPATDRHTVEHVERVKHLEQVKHLEKGEHPVGHSSLGQPCKLMLVDDNVDAAMILGELFATSDYVVEIAHDGMEAIAKATEFHPAVIVMDIGLPGMDGYEVARRIRRLPLVGNAKLIALTGWGSQQDREMAMQAGFDLHLVKPIAFRALCSHVETVLTSTTEQAISS